MNSSSWSKQLGKKFYSQGGKKGDLLMSSISREELADLRNRGGGWSEYRAWSLTVTPNANIKVRRTAHDLAPIAISDIKIHRFTPLLFLDLKCIIKQRDVWIPGTHPLFCIVQPVDRVNGFLKFLPDPQNHRAIAFFFSLFFFSITNTYNRAWN